MPNLHRIAAILLMVLTCATGVAAEIAGPESKRLGRAKDLIADEQWTLAIDELKAAVGDPKETRKDEVLYWLAHSLNQSGDRAAAVETIARLEREYRSSMWLKPARALRLEIAVRLNRNDILWSIVNPVSDGPAVTGAPPKRPPTRKGTSDGRPVPLVIWEPLMFHPDLDLQIQALGALMRTDADRVMPRLRDIAFESGKPEQASRAVFMLAQSELPKAREMVVQVAKTAPEPAQMAAVKALGRIGGPHMSQELMQVYVTAKEPVKFQIVKSLGERAEKGALLRIVESEKDSKIRYRAIEGLGEAGAVTQLFSMYRSANLPGKRSIIIGLFIARADAELIRIDELERPMGNTVVRQDIHERLRLLGTPRAKDYLQKVSETR
jgi:HEAT repeat protein